MFEEFTRYVVTLARNPDVPRPEALIREHVAYLQQLEARGALELAGPFEDGRGGMLILRTDSPAQAEAMAAADPFVLAGSATPEVRAWTLSCAENGHLGMG